MNRSKLTFLVALLVFMSVSVSSFAQSFESEQNSRKGFFAGFGLGAGMRKLSLAGTSTSKATGLFDVKIGAGVTDNILVMYNGSGSAGDVNGVSVSVFNSSVAAQIFFAEHWYVRPGLGISISNATVAGVSATSDISFGVDLAAGYEFRFGKRFSLSPEMTYHYSKIKDPLLSGNSHMIGVQASLLWYF